MPYDSLGGSSRMGSEGLLAVLALLVGIYAVIPSERRLDLRLRLTRFDWATLFGALLVVHYIKFWPVLYAFGLAPDLGPWRWGFEAESASYTVLVGAGVLVWLRSRARRVGLSSIGTFRDLTERELFDGKLSDLLFLFEGHLEALFRVYRVDYVLPRLQRRLDPPMFHFLVDQANAPTQPTRMRAAWSALKRRVAAVLPAYEEERGLAEDVVRRVLLAEPFVAYIARARPYFALRVLQQEGRERNDFVDLYLRALLADPTSVLYFEVRHNDAYKGGMYRFQIDPRNRLLHFLLDDAQVAQGLGVYKPLGDATQEYLDELHAKPSADPLIEPTRDYEEQRWKWRPYATIRFFDLMVREALYQGVEWHMWLYYLESIARRMIRNLAAVQPNVDLSREFPTPYHYLLYEIVDALRDWIRAAEDVPEDQANVVLENEHADHENGNIPKSAILALGMTMRHVIEAATLSVPFKAYLLEMLLRAYFEMLSLPRMAPYARVLKNTLIKGGVGWFGRGRAYREQLLEVLDEVDTIPFLGQEFDSLVQAIQGAKED